MSRHAKSIIVSVAVTAISSCKSQGLEGGATAALYVCGPSHLLDLLRQPHAKAFKLGTTGAGASQNAPST